MEEPSLMSDRLLKALVVAGSLSAGAPCSAHETTAQEIASETKAEPERSIEDLNLIGAAVTMPAFADTVFGTESGFRRALFSKGMAFRVNVIPRYSQNLLDRPVPEVQQVYIGQRPTFISGVNPIFTADLRQLGLRQAQLNVGFGWKYTNWSPAGQNTLAMTSLHFFKRWGDRRVEMKAGYLGNDLEENLGSVDVELDAGDLSAIDEASSSVVVQGARYPEVQERLTGR
jgi:hypothetical protein